MMNINIKKLMEAIEDTSSDVCLGYDNSRVVIGTNNQSKVFTLTCHSVSNAEEEDLGVAKERYEAITEDTLEKEIQDEYKSHN